MIFFLVFFFKIRLIDPILGKAFDAKRRKKGMALVYVGIRTENSRATLEGGGEAVWRQDKVSWNA